MRALKLFAIVALFGAAAIASSNAQSPPPRPRITGIDHVAYRTSDPAAARAFYAGVLGLKEEPSGLKGTLEFAVGRQHVRVEPRLEPRHDERLSHIAFATPDVAALAAYLTARGLRSSQSSDGCTADAVRVSDADGHTIEFVQVPWPPSPFASDRHAVSSRLLHAGVIVRDEEAAGRFYRDVLGFSEIWRGGRTEGATDWINMRLPESTDYIEYMLTKDEPDRRQRGSMHHIALLVPDIQTAWETIAARLSVAERATLATPQVGRNGRWQLNLYDPDGTRTELMEPFRIR